VLTIAFVFQQDDLLYLFKVTTHLLLTFNSSKNLVIDISVMKIILNFNFC